jgi:hypothetical protein
LTQDSETKTDNQNNVGCLLLTAFILLILAFACGPTILPILNQCQDVIPHRRDANIAPLMDLVIPAGFDLSKWTNKEAELQSMGRNGVFTNVERFSSIAAAHEEFNFKCDSWGASVNYGGQGDNQYCISAIRTLREDPEGLCISVGRYSSYVIIQKGDVIIEIHEESSDKNSTQKDIAIEQLVLGINQSIRK